MHEYFHITYYVMGAPNSWENCYEDFCTSVCKIYDVIYNYSCFSLILSSHFCLVHTVQLIFCRTITCKNILDDYLFTIFIDMVGLGAILQPNMMGTTVFPNMVQYFTILQPHVVGSGAETRLKHSGVLHDSEK